MASLIEKLIAMWGNGAQWKNAGGDDPHEATFLKLDSSKAHFKLGWRPRLGFDDALRLTAAWHQQDLKRSASSMRDFTIGQIREYVGA